MQLLILSFLASFLATLLIVRSAAVHARVSADSDMTGPQKFHSQPVPRIGGLGVIVGVIVGVIWAERSHTLMASIPWLLLACAMPAFLSGVAEDMACDIKPRSRLVLTAVSAGLAIWLIDGLIVRTAIPGIESMIAWYPFACALTVFAVTGVAHAVNIIDGFNGLASMCALLMLLAVAYVAYQVGDATVFATALITAGAVFGFFVWNFPAGLVFLGDGGAYLLGFVLAELNLLLLHRNPSVSPIFPLLLCAYPIFETVFTIYRRRIIRGVAAGAPDGIHLHTLIYRRVIRQFTARVLQTPNRRNSMTAPYLWMLCLMSVIPALLWWDNTAVLTGFLMLFMVSYVVLYWRILMFRTPRWLVVRRR